MKFTHLKGMSEPFFYITNDVSRGIGLERLLPNYHIICLDDHPLVDYLENGGVSVFCLERKLGKRNLIFRNSGFILENELVLDFIKVKSEGKRPNILYFKPQKKIDILSEKHNFNLIGNSTEINNFFEDKILFFELCQKNNIKTPPSEVGFFSEMRYCSLQKKYSEKIVIQFGKGWAGNSTFFINNEKDFQSLQSKYLNKKIKVSKFIKGKTFLNNATIFGRKIFSSKPAIQIKAEEELTSTQAGTGGRQWKEENDNEIVKKIDELTQQTGKALSDLGYKGFFGLDFIFDEISGEIFVSECNARFTASAPFYSQLEMESNIFPLIGFHILEFLDSPSTPDKIFQRADLVGGEIIARNTANKPVIVNIDLPTGIYDKKLNFIKKSISLGNTDKEYFWLTTAGFGRKVNPEIEILKLDTHNDVCNNEGELKDEYKQIILNVKEKLILK